MDCETATSMLASPDAAVQAHLQTCENCRNLANGLAVVPILIQGALEKQVSEAAAAEVSQVVLNRLVTEGELSASVRQALHTPLTPEQEAALYEQGEEEQAG